MNFNSPMSSDKANRLIDLLALSPKNQILDVGCGTGEFLIRVVEATEADGLGMDIDAESISAAQKSATGRVSPDSCTFQVADIQAALPEPNSLDLAICIGSTHAFGMGDVAYPNALQHLMQAVRPGGQLLIGEGYWKQTPAPDYLAFLGDPSGIYHTHAENIAFAEARGLVPLYATVSNEDEWDDFEWSHKLRIERAAAQFPDNPALAEKLARSRKWRDGYLRWGRDTMGFGFYLFMKQGN